MESVTLPKRLRAPRIPRGLLAPLKAQITRQRASVAAAAFGGVVGLAIGFAYLGGAVAQSATVRGQANRIAGAYDSGFTEEALAAAVGGLDHSALIIARRHDPYTVAGAAQRDRQAAMLTAMLEQRRGGAQLIQASTGPTDLRGPLDVQGAPAFRLNGALEGSRDLDCLTLAVYYEARGEGQAGMQAVAQVILNRVRSSAFPNTVCGVIFQGAGRRTGCQFSFACDGSMRGRREGGAWERSRRVAARALDGYVYAPVGNATHFHTTAVNPRWSGSLTRVTQVGQHIFYRFGGRRGRGGGQFTYTPEREAPREVETLQASLVPTEAIEQAGERVVSALTGETVPAATAETPAQPPAPVAVPSAVEIVATARPTA